MNAGAKLNDFGLFSLQVGCLSFSKNCMNLKGAAVWPLDEADDGK